MEEGVSETSPVDPALESTSVSGYLPGAEGGRREGCGCARRR